MNNTLPTESGIRTVNIEKTAEEMGRKAAHDIAAELRLRLAVQPSVRVIFAAAPSQNEMLHALIQEPGIDWTRVIAFHMDEYIGLQPDAPQLFSLWLRHAIFDHLPFGAVHLIQPGDNPALAAAHYAEKLAEKPIDLVCLGIGVNGHLAFNDPPADFYASDAVKLVDLDESCRQQQVDDACFQHLSEVPLQAITLTIPRLLAADRLFCCVPGVRKKNAVTRTLKDPMHPSCPATALRLHPNCILYLDHESAADVL